MARPVGCRLALRTVHIPPIIDLSVLDRKNLVTKQPTRIVFSRKLLYRGPVRGGSHLGRENPPRGLARGDRGASWTEGNVVFPSPDDRLEIPVRPAILPNPAPVEEIENRDATRLGGDGDVRTPGDCLPPLNPLT